MSTIDRLEAEGQFPGRIRLEPTNRVAWVRREVTAYLRHLGRRRQSAPQEDTSSRPIRWRFSRIPRRTQPAPRPFDTNFVHSGTTRMTTIIGGQKWRPKKEGLNWLASRIQYRNPRRTTAATA
jgi:hypothetical protein